MKKLNPLYSLMVLVAFISLGYANPFSNLFRVGGCVLDDARSALCIPTSSEECYFNGFYGGVSAGYTHFETSRSEFLGEEPAPSITNRDFDQNRASLDLFLGYNYRFCNSCWVFGLEPFVGFRFEDFTARYLTFGGVPVANEVERRLDLGIAFKLGYVIQEQTMIYGFVGPKFGYFRYNTFADNSPQARGRDNTWIPAVFYGVGIEHYFGPVILGAQVSISHYAHRTLTAIDTVGDVHKANIHPHDVNVSLRLSVPFNVFF